MSKRNQGSQGPSSYCSALIAVAHDSFLAPPGCGEACSLCHAIGLPADSASWAPLPSTTGRPCGRASAVLGACPIHRSGSFDFSQLSSEMVDMGKPIQECSVILSLSEIGSELVVLSS